MKLLLVFAALVAWCAGNAIPLVPGDNSHYVEGESRYIWMPDGEGNLHLVDLEEPVDEAVLNSRNGANNQYWLFTRSNPSNPQVIVNGNVNTIRNSNYNGNLPLNVIVHGWNSNGWTQMNPDITSALLAVTNCNVIVVDWRALANSGYNTAAAGVPGVGQFLGNFLVWLRNNGGGGAAWNNVHLIGFSLGAHVVGNAGRQAGGRAARVTGLDPAGPTWGNNGNALNRNAGAYVEAIHTDGGLLGIMDAIGDANFYPNGGRNPPHPINLYLPPIGCAGNAIPLVPGDNSHYVEGESRYIWMPDGEGNLHLVDLEEPVDEAVLNSRNGANNQYWLFTRSNPSNPQVIVNGNVNTIRNSNYNGNLPLNVIVHGWNSNGWTQMNPDITSALLAVTNCNVIVVDWRALANSGYNTAAAGVPGVGQFLGNFLVWLRNNGGGGAAWNNVHLIGFSLGAHVVGNAGRQAGGRAARVTGLDPAGPTWGNNGNALNRNAGAYVEAIHTDGGLLGIMDAIGDANFYPNGGRNPQPGCWISTCSHGRATELFASTVRFNHLQGRRCNNIWEAELGNCNGANFRMGNGDWNKRGSGIHGLRTGNSWPF